MIPRREDLGPWQALQPLKVGLEVTMVSRHGDVARQEHEVVPTDSVSPV